MRGIKKGDVVSRESYNNDILFYVENIINDNRNSKIAILKGITIRVEADAPFSDLRAVDDNSVSKVINDFYKKLNIEDYTKNNRTMKQYGKILHLDGDKRYSEKTEKYYKKKGLNYIVKHVVEHKQPNVVTSLLQRYKPNILVITGHDGMIKKGKNYSDINNYRNSKYFM